MSFYGQMLQEDYQVSQGQIIAYRKQLDNLRKEIDEERRSGQQLEIEVHVQLPEAYTEKFLGGFQWLKVTKQGVWGAQPLR